MQDTERRGTLHGMDMNQMVAESGAQAVCSSMATVPQSMGRAGSPRREQALLPSYA
ncbi:MAG: hypothetical protein LBF87_04840 [Treponema sp.]|nr:hypothetical protein [Treponema sp.]